jgi:hypothetical protein
VPEPDPPQLLCRYQKAADALDCSRRLIPNLVAAGLLDKVKLGRANRVTWRSVRALAEKRASQPK